MNSKPSRRGYAMVLVIVFVAIVNLFMVLSYKHFAAAIRVQSVYKSARERDEGVVLALAAGLALLEMETPAVSGVSEYEISLGGGWYVVAYAGEGQTWTATAIPASDEPGLPDLAARIQEVATPPPSE